MRGTCGVDTKAFFYGNAIPNIITDVALLVLPMPFIWRLHLSQMRKVLLTCIFIMCILYVQLPPFLLAFVGQPCEKKSDLSNDSVVAVSITRLVYILTVDFSSPDVTWNLVNIATWTCIEPHIGIVCGKSFISFCYCNCSPLYYQGARALVHSTRRNIEANITHA